MTEISEKTIKIIEEKKITPTPRWRFLLKNYVIWAFFAASIIIGALAITTIIFILTDSDWDVYKYLDRTLFEHIFVSIPYVWFAVLALFVIVAHYNYKQTRSGYRYGTFFAVGGSVILSLALGIILFFAGLDSEIHEFFSRQIPFYETIIYSKKDVWTNAERGLLAGEITDVKSQDEFTLRDLDGNIWQIKGKNLVWFGPSLPQKNVEIKLIGKIVNDSVFSPEVVRPWNDH
jgi:hypothetical protein